MLSFYNISILIRKFSGITVFHSSSYGSNIVLPKSLRLLLNIIFKMKMEILRWKWNEFDAFSFYVISFFMLKTESLDRSMYMILVCIGMQRLYFVYIHSIISISLSSLNQLLTNICLCIDVWKSRNKRIAHNNKTSETNTHNINKRTPQVSVCVFMYFYLKLHNKCATYLEFCWNIFFIICLLSFSLNVLQRG